MKIYSFTYTLVIWSYCDLFCSGLFSLNSDAAADWHRSYDIAP